MLRFPSSNPHFCLPRLTSRRPAFDYDDSGFAFSRVLVNLLSLAETTLYGGRLAHMWHQQTHHALSAIIFRSIYLFNFYI